jgi:chromate transporter
MSLWHFAGLVGLFNLMTFGNGPVMVPMLQQHLVAGAGILTPDQLLYAFAIARVTPGQANTYVAAIGWMLYGWAGAILATIAIQLPGYLMLPLMRLWERFRHAARVRGFVRGLTATSVGLIFAATIEIGRDTLTGWVPVLVLALALLALEWRRWHPLAAIAGAGGVGLALRVAGLG